MANRPNARHAPTSRTLMISMLESLPSWPGLETRPDSDAIRVEVGLRSVVSPCDDVCRHARARSERWVMSVGQTAWRLDVKPREYVAIESGDSWPSFETYDRICKLFGWPQTFSRDTGAMGG